MKILAIIFIYGTLLFGVVDINNANKSELMSLSGVGPKKADAIFNYRKTHCFKTLDGLRAVKGIGKKTMEKNKAELSVGKCKK